MRAVIVLFFLMPTIPLFGQPAGRGAAAGDFELSVQVHDLFQPTCTDALLSPNGKTAFFVDQQITEIDLVTGKCLRTFGAPQQTWRSGGSFGGGVSGYEIASLSINAAALLAEGKRILAVDDELVRVWNAADGSLVAAYTISGAQGLETAAVSGDERYCIVSDNSNRLFLLDLDTGESRPIETGPVGKVGSMVCSHRGHRLLVAGSLGLFYFPDFTAVHPQSVQERFDVEDGAADGAMSVSFSDDDSLFAGTRTNRILVCDQKGDRVESIPATGVMQVRFDTDPEKLYVYSAGWNDDGSSAIVLYNRRTVEVEAEYPNLFPGYGRRFALDSAHGRLLSTNYQLWDIERNRRRDLSHYNRLSLPAIASFEPPLLKFDGVTLDLSSLAVRQTARTQRRPTDKSRTYYWDAELGLGIYEDFDFFHEFGLFVASADGQRRLGRVGPAVSHASRAALSPDGKRYAYGDLNGSIFAGGVGSGDAGLIGRSPGGTIEALSYPADNILYSGDSKGYLTEWDLTGTRPIRRAKVAEGSITAILADDESTHLYVGDTNGNLSVRDADLKKLGSIRIGTSAVSGLRLDPAGRFLFALSDSILKIVDLSTLRWTAFAATREASEWICFTDDGYWDGSANCTDLIAMVDGFDAYGVDQFAARNNRPDIILKRLGYAEQSLLDHFEHQHAKRLRRLGLSEQELSGDMRDMPEARIVASRKEGRNLFLTVRLNGRSADLSSWNLWVNDVPLFGALGRPVDGRSREVTHTVILNPGINKVEAGCLNEKGIEALRVPVYVDYDGQVSRRLYYLGFGVSKYADRDLTLGWPAKDVNDLANLFKGLEGHGFERVVVKTFTDAAVTPVAIERAKRMFADARPEDVVVLFISGHGVHDNDPEATYYFVTYNANVDNLSSTSANFDLVEDLLQGIAPRDKLFLMDTCESGELDEDLAIAPFTGGKGVHTRAIRPRGGTSAGVRQVLTERNRWIYNDVVRRSGAVVFSSCRGDESSYEFDDLENGAFTAALKECFTDRAADTNGDQRISKRELTRYVSARVEALVEERTGFDLQHPTVDRDNLEQQLLLPLVR